jgi:hypothetical protein
MDLEKLYEAYPKEQFNIVEGFDDAIIGVDEKTHRVVYSVDKCLQILLEQGLSSTEAVEYFDFKVVGVHISDDAPIWCDDTMFV